jgi:hypothetical protein
MSSIPAAYRDDAAVARLQYEEQAARWNSVAASLSSAAEVHVIRSGRIAAGAAGILGVATLVTVGVIELHQIGSRPTGMLSLILVATWVAIVIAYHGARRVAGARAARAAIAPACSDDPWADLARLDASPPGASLRARAAAQERASAALPMIALALLFPLSLHGVLFAIGAVCTGNAAALWIYDGWILLCAGVVGHAHLALACFCVSFARGLKSIPDEDLVSEAERRNRKAFWWTVGISAIPGGYFFLIPPILVAITGALFCKPMFNRIAQEILLERQELGEAQAA